MILLRKERQLTFYARMYPRAVMQEYLSHMAGLWGVCIVAESLTAGLLGIFETYRAEK